jgi:hypothetical protein
MTNGSRVGSRIASRIGSRIGAPVGVEAVDRSPAQSGPAGLTRGGVRREPQWI